MSLLSHETLIEALDTEDLDRRLVVMPMLDRDFQIGPATIDVRLGTRFRLLRRTDEAGVDPGVHSQGVMERSQQHVTIAFGDALWLHPGQFVLGSTLEFLRFPSNLAGYVVGRSSWGRAGWRWLPRSWCSRVSRGSLTLELVNHGEGPIALYAGCRIAQLAVHTLDSPTDHGYKGKYAGPIGPQVSRLARESDDIARAQGRGQEASKLIAPRAGRGGAGFLRSHLRTRRRG